MLFSVERKIQIAGGGLAGLILGLLLRRDNVPVEIWDAGSYPRHKVCGEFISGRGLEILRQMSLPGMSEIGSSAETVQFFDSIGRSRIVRLPESGLSVDRAKLDLLLANEFERMGGILRKNCRWTASFRTEGLVRATGRRLDKTPSAGLIGLKAHARNIPLNADLEMHYSDRGYVGLSRQQNGVTNVCALFRNATGRIDRDDLIGAFTRDAEASLRGKLREAEIEKDTFAAIAGISLKRENTDNTKECRIGDSICVIPPMTGNGMSLAIESAAIAAPFLRDYSGGVSDWEDTVTAISQSCEKALNRRLRIAGILQNICFTRMGRVGLLATLWVVPKSMNGWFWLTR
jgi:menaquinone-9 beta-reductase